MSAPDRVREALTEVLRHADGFDIGASIRRDAGDDDECSRNWYRVIQMARAALAAPVSPPAASLPLSVMPGAPWNILDAGGLRVAACFRNDNLSDHVPADEALAAEIVRRFNAAPPAPRGEAAVRPEVVCLCGSTRFIDTFAEQYGRLTDEGKIVLTVGRVVPQSEQALGSPRKAALDVLHLRKIDLADRVLVLNVGGYVGPSTRREIAYAKERGKPIDLLYPDAGLDGVAPVSPAPRGEAVAWCIMRKNGRILGDKTWPNRDDAERELASCRLLLSITTEASGYRVVALVPKEAP